MPHPCVVCLLAHNYDDAIQFYCDKLQLFRVATDTRFGGGYRMVILDFNCTSSPFSMNVNVAGLGERSVVGRQGGEFLFLTLPICDADSMLERLRKHDVFIEGGINELPFGRQIVIVDECGNRVSLFQYPDESEPPEL